MTVDQDREDLAHHEAEVEQHTSFNYALFDADEAALLGCVYIDPSEKVGADAEICWWSSTLPLAPRSRPTSTASSRPGWPTGGRFAGPAISVGT
jgi:hypothetical protein